MDVTLFHGSGVTVEKPEIRKTVYTKDFGYGFYTTTNRVQAENFAQKVTVRRGGTPV